jgi:hypothetical protein
MVSSEKVQELAQQVRVPEARRAPRDSHGALPARDSADRHAKVSSEVVERKASVLADLAGSAVSGEPPGEAELWCGRAHVSRYSREVAISFPF